jgi:transcriptional regulator with GAF, ATPase, and Fis domain/tetratricopeptide (TPR) repeat protein
MADERVASLAPAWRGALEAEGRSLVVIDPTGAQGARGLNEALESVVRDLARRGALTSEVEDLLEWQQDQEQRWIGGVWSERDGGQDVMARLYKALCAIKPLVMVVLRAGQAGPELEGQLLYLARYVFADPIGALVPAVLMRRERVPGALVLTMDAGSAARWEALGVVLSRVDMTASLEASVRAYLGREDVVRRLVEGTRGDLGRLDALVSHVGQGVAHLWSYRLNGLDPVERVALELLAVCEGPVEVSRLAGALGALGQSAPMAALVKRLVSEGLVTRTMQLGAARLALVDPALKDAVRAEDVAGLHEAWVRAALEEREEDGEWAVFVARHALEAGMAQVALEQGARAARRLMSAGALEDAAQLVERLWPVAAERGESVALAELHAMLVDLYSRMGRWRAALKHCGLLRRYVVGARGRAELACRTASLLLKLHRYETVVTLTEEVLGSLEPGWCAVRVRALLEQAEARYELGQSEAAADRARHALAVLDEAEASAVMGAQEVGQARIWARNQLGKVAILGARYEQAIALFGENEALAERWGWSGELARAQGNLGVVAMQRRDYAQAQRYLERALEASRTAGGVVTRATCLLNLSMIHQYREDYAQALDCSLEALRLARQAGEDGTFSSAAYNLATLYRDMGALEYAERLVAHLKAQDAPQRHTFITPWLTLLEAGMLLEREQHGAALELLSEEPAAQTAGLLYGLRTRELRAAEAALGLGRVAQARRVVEQVSSDDPEREEPQVEALLAFLQGRLAVLDGEDARAEALFRTASTLWGKACHKRDATRAELWLAQVLRRLGREEEAARLLAARADEIVARAERVPAALRAEFMRLPLHGRVVEALEAAGGAVPVALREAHRAPLSAPPGAQATPAAPVRDAAWQRWRSQFGSIVGDSPRLHQIFRVVERVAASDASVLVLGESGTGKELVAEALHALSGRKDGPLVKVNCAAFVESLLLSELFGHEKGAFTGAVSQKIGRFELANGGTIFLDEIADISAQTQVALLRVLQERVIERVGGQGVVPINVRVVCATNKNLEELVRKGEFRLDLYYRLKGVVLELPSLRERREDIPALIDSFARRFAGANAPRFMPEVLRYLMAYSWPGNVRELQNFVKSVLLFVEGDAVLMSHVRDFADFFAHGEFAATIPQLPISYDIPAAPPQSHATPAVVVPMRPPKMAEDEMDGDEDDVYVLSADGSPEDALVEHIVAQGLSINRLKKRLELECIRRALEETQGNVTQAAKLLQMKRPRLSQIINATPELAAFKNKLVG